MLTRCTRCTNQITHTAPLRAKVFPRSLRFGRLNLGSSDAPRVCVCALPALFSVRVFFSQTTASEIYSGICSGASHLPEGGRGC